MLDSKAKCEDCNMCVPREDLSNQTEWKFPEEMECSFHTICYPNQINNMKY